MFSMCLTRAIPIIAWLWAAWAAIHDADNCPICDQEDLWTG